MENTIENLEETTRGGIARKPHFPIINLPHGDYHLLVIGINNYENKYSYTHLPNATKDAQDLAEELQKRYKFKPEHVKKLSNEEATREAILKSIELLESNVKPRDNVIIFFAGHGYRQQPLGYIVPYDAQARTKSGFIPYSTIVDHFHLIPAKHILLIVDCCYGGSLMNNRGNESNNTDVQGLEASVSRKFISSGHDDEQVLDGLVGSNSPFMRLLLDTLKTNQEEKLPIHALYSQIIKKIEEEKLQIPTPRCSPLTQVGDKNGDMVLRLGDSENEEANSAIKFPTKTAFENYFNKYKKGKNKRKVLDAMKAEQKIQKDTWDKAKKEATFDAINTYLDRFKDGFHVLEANESIIELEDKSNTLYLKAQKAIKSAEKILGKRILKFGEKLDNSIIEKYQQAIEYLDKAIALNPQFLEYYYLRLSVNKILQNNQAMLNDYDKILEMDMDIEFVIKSFYYGDRALLKAKMGMVEEALSDMDKIIDMDKDKSMHYINRGVVNERIGNYESAIKDYEIASELSPLNAFVPREMIKNVEQLISDKKNTK